MNDSVLDVLNRIGYVQLRDFGQSWRTRPLYRQSNNSTSLSINKETGDWYDFSLNQGGKLRSLVQMTLNLSTKEEIDNLLSKITVVANKQKYTLSAPRKYDRNMLVKLRQDHSYWIGRGVPESVLKSFEGGVATGGEMIKRYVFPIFKGGDLVGFAGRALIDSPNYPKWKLLGKKKDWCYPLHLNEKDIRSTKSVILVESIGDLLALWKCGIKNCLCVFGIDIGPEIIKTLIKFDIQQIIIAFNNDADNNFVGNDSADKMRGQLLQYFDAQQVRISLPEKKDFGIMSEEEIILWKNQLTKN